MLISIISFVIMLFIVGLDQLSKFLVYGKVAHSVIGNVLWFESTLNTGAAFSFLENHGWVFIVLASLASVLLLWLIISKRFFTARFEKIVFAIILGGTLSNLIDRCIFGGVRDFISLRFIHFAIFNVADIAIVIGCITLVIYWLARSIKKDKK